MAERFDYWIHGVNVQVEQPSIANIKRLGWGTVVKQQKDTKNWFHFAIPTPTWLDNDRVDLDLIAFKGKINTGATIDLITLHKAGVMERIETWKVSLSATDIGWEKLCNIQNLETALALCIHVDFDGHDGEVMFAGCGAKFWEQT